MANITSEEDKKDFEERKANNGNRLHGRTFPSTRRAEAYNILNGTSVENDEILDQILKSESRRKFI